jgi:hypothetical protein
MIYDKGNLNIKKDSCVRDSLSNNFDMKVGQFVDVNASRDGGEKLFEIPMFSQLPQ